MPRVDIPGAHGQTEPVRLSLEIRPVIDTADPAMGTVIKALAELLLGRRPEPEGPPRAPTNPDKLLLTVPQAARLLEIGRSQAYALVADGTIPSVRLGARRVRIPLAALEERLRDMSRRDGAGNHTK